MSDWHRGRARSVTPVDSLVTTDYAPSDASPDRGEQIKRNVSPNRGEQQHRKDVRPASPPQTEQMIHIGANKFLNMILWKPNQSRIISDISLTVFPAGRSGTRTAVARDACRELQSSSTVNREIKIEGLDEQESIGCTVPEIYEARVGQKLIIAKYDYAQKIIDIIKAHANRPESNWSHFALWMAVVAAYDEQPLGDAFVTCIQSKAPWLASGEAKTLAEHFLQTRDISVYTKFEVTDGSGPPSLVLRRHRSKGTDVSYFIM